jgi:hypothetical protein
MITTAYGLIDCEKTITRFVCQVVTTGSCSGVVGDQMDASQGGGGGPYRCCAADDDNAARRHLSPTRPRTNFRS